MLLSCTSRWNMYRGFTGLVHEQLRVGDLVPAVSADIGMYR